MNNMVITMYADNDTIVNGGKVCNMKGKYAVQKCTAIFRITD